MAQPELTPVEKLWEEILASLEQEARRQERATDRYLAEQLAELERGGSGS